jgi:hypothetical protein
MHEAVFWVGFIGAWLLFVGPVYQSALELREEEEARTSMQKALENAPPPERFSPWWWLLPPVAIVMLFRRRGQYMGIIDTLMSEEDRRSIGHYKAVARGWWYVGAGAWFIFLKEAWELAEHHEWTLTTYWVTVVLMTMVALGGVGAGGDRSARNRRRSYGGVTTSPGDGPRPAARS